MTVDTGRTRSSRELESDGERYRAALAWRGRSSGRGLVYFLALDGDEPDPDDRRDRRVPLTDADAFAELSEGELSGLLEEAAPLTETERRFRAPDGRLWLAQSVGPVWADEDPAEGSTGLLLTALEGEPERLRGPGVHVGRLDGTELADLWRRAGDGEREGEEDAVGDDGGEADGA